MIDKKYLPVIQLLYFNVSNAVSTLRKPVECGVTQLKTGINKNKTIPSKKKKVMSQQSTHNFFHRLS